MRILKHAVALGGALSVASSPAHAAWDVNLRVGVTELSRDIYHLHMLILVICVVIAAAVFSVMIYSIATFRKSKGAVPATFDHSQVAEIVWTIIPAFILIAMAIPAARTLVKIDDTQGSEMTVKVTGYQWKWQYELVGENGRLVLDARRGPAMMRGAWTRESTRAPCRTTCSRSTTRWWCRRGSRFGCC
jgi:cytochrome c oxidase subunit 2